MRLLVREATPGVLHIAGEGADALWRAGDAFPFADRAADAIDCGAPVAALPPRLRVPFLLECRRVLRTGGALRLRFPAGPKGEWRRLLRLVGLEENAASPAAHEGCSTLDARKRDRASADAPLVSILVPAFNPRYFAAALDSALAQTWRNLEIVVGDDSPGPEIEAIARSRAGAIPIRYERNPVRLRTRGNCVRCFERADGEFVKFLNDDDLLAPACVETLVGAFRASPEVTLATSCRALVDETGNVLPDTPSTMPILGETRLVAGHSLANTMIGAGLNVVGEPSTALFRKADLADQAPDYFRFDDVVGLGIVDMVSWAALLLRGDAVYFTERLSAFRAHDEHDYAPGAGSRAVASIRSLQAAWLPLGVFGLLPPDLLVTRSWPPRERDEWRLEQVLSFVPRAATPEARLAAWRAERAAD